VKPLDPDLVADAARHPAVVTIEDGFADGGAGTALAAAIGAVAVAQERPAPTVTVMGIPCAYFPHGKPDDILAELGLDAAGVVGAAREAIAAAGSL
jgi:1-deoxy-D-xylulose-5-phosphate synthase